MIYSHKTDTFRRNMSSEEKAKLKKLRYAKGTAWMIDKNLCVS